MALIKCPECGRRISENAESCPNCGRPIKKRKRDSGVVTAICYVTNFISAVLVLTDVSNIFAWTPMIWGVSFSVYCSSKNDGEEDVSDFKKLRRINYIVFAIFFVVTSLFTYIKEETRDIEEVLVCYIAHEPLLK